MILSELQQRHSVRSFAAGRLDEQMQNSLKALVTDINTHEAGMKFQLVFDDDDPFRGITRSYGMFRNARNYLAPVVDTSFPHFLERAGYYAEQFSVAVTLKGLGSCFVGGTFSPSHVNARIRVGEILPFIVVFGVPEEEKTGWVARMATKMCHRKSLEPDEFYVDRGISLPRAMEIMPQLGEGLQALACAPSSLNKQPARVSMDQEGNIHAFLETPSEKGTIDLGIAKYNFQAVVPGVWDWGNDAVLLV